MAVMKFTAPVILMFFALATLLLTFFGDDSYSRLMTLRRSVEHQSGTNSRLQDQVSGLKREVVSLQNDPRAIEKAARSELGMARSDEIVIIFNKSSGTDGNGKSR